MISQLTRLDVSDFRCIAGTHSIPLDSRIVVVHGPNGSGKSALLQALEYALTGGVRDLERYEADYPRCLTNQFGDRQASVTLHCLDEDGQPLSFGQGPGPASSAAQHHFRERAYLSQHQLTKLLDPYEDAPIEEGEQPLVRFIQDLLQLDDLQSLNEGLRVAWDIRNLRKECHQLKHLESRVAQFSARVDALQTEIRECDSQMANAAAVLGTALAELHGPGVSLDAAERDVAVVTIQAFLDETLADVTETDERLARRLASVVEARQTERDAAAEGLDGAVGALEARDEARSALRDAEQVLSGHRHVVEQRLSAIVPALQMRVDEPDDLAFLASARHALQALGMETHSALARVPEATRELSRLRTELAEFDERATVLADASDEQIVRIEELTALLVSTDHLLDSSICPVCDRDFSETESGLLSDYVRQRIANLRVECAGTVERATARRECLSRQVALGQEISRLEEELASLPTLGELTSRSQATDDAQRAVVAASAIGEKVAGLLERLAEAEERLQTTMRTDARTRHAQVALIGLAEELGLPISDPHGSLSLSALADSVERATATAESACRARRDALGAASDALRDVQSAMEQMEALLEEAHRASKGAEDVERRRAQVKELQELARNLGQASSRTRAAALTKLIDGDLNVLWQDLFVRLVPSERFRPKLTSPSVQHRKLRVAARVVADGVDPLSAGATLSAGNLNTAALCLFLAINTLEAAETPVLVLDDPVQSMDDVHLVNFAALLTALARDANRQVVVAVHERALFEYLMHQLGPTQVGDQLLGLELERASSRRWTCRATRKQWEPDQMMVS